MAINKGADLQGHQNGLALDTNAQEALQHFLKGYVAVAAKSCANKNSRT